MVLFRKLFDNFGRLLVGLSFLLIGFMPSTAQATTEDWALIGQFGGKTQAITVQDHVIYAGIGSRLAVMNTANPASPTIAGMSAPFHDFVRDIAVSGQVAYIAAGGDGIGIVNVSDPAHPLMVGTLDTRGYAEGIAVNGSTIYLADGPYGLRVLDASGPSGPVEVGKAYSFNYAFDVAMAGNYAYIAAGGSGLLVADVSDPYHPREIGQVNTPGYAYDAVVAGNTAYVADDWDGVSVVDISNPAHPTLIGKCSTPGWALSVALSGTNLYVGDGDAGLRVCDVSNRTAPLDIGSSVGDDGFARRVAADGDVVYIADAMMGIRVINIASPAQPQQVGVYSAMAESRRVTVVGNYAYVAAGPEGGMQILDITNPVNPVQVSHFYMNGYASDVVVSGSYAYLTTMSPGTNIITVINIANPAYPVLASVITSESLCPLCAEPYDIALQGNMVYLADGRGLRIFDISVPTSIHLEGEIHPISDMGAATQVAVMGNYAFLAEGFDGVTIIDITDPAHPNLMKAFNTLGVYQAVAAANNRLYAASRSTVQVFDISNPAAPVEMGHYDSPGSISSLSISGNELIISDGGGGVQVLDVSDPALLALSASFETLGFTYDSFRSGDTLYVSAGTSGLLIFQKQAAAKANGETHRPSVQQPGDYLTEMGTFLPGEIRHRLDDSIVSSPSASPAGEPFPASAMSQNPPATNSSCVVSTAADSGSGSLRRCLEDGGSGTVITFSTVAFPPGSPAIIHLSSPLPFLDDGWVTIDGSNAGVVLDGGRAIGEGLHIVSSHNTIMGLQIMNFTVGLFLNLDGQYNQIGGDRTIGTGPSGQGNVFGGNDCAISIAHTRYNTIKGNLVGTNASGTDANIARNVNGIVVLSYAYYNQIGGLTPGERNIISGNLWRGIDIFGDHASWNVVIGNYIGTDVTGTKPISNDFAGIVVECGASNNIIGGRTPSERNLISGNINTGVIFSDPITTQNTVIGNIIGLDATGTSALPNETGVLVWNSGFNRVGGSLPGEGNLVSGNSNKGVGIGGVGQLDNVIMGNQIGEDLYGHPITGSSIGIMITDGAQHNFIGGLSSGEGNRINNNLIGVEFNVAGIKYNWIAGNTISAHAYYGIYIHQQAEHNFITRNYLSGNRVGIWVNEASYNTLRANSITGNQSFGIWLTEGGNQSIAAPEISELDELHVVGKACPACTVEIFSDPGDQGQRYEGATVADQAGNFQYAKRLYGPNVTATSTDSAGNTSQFSSPSPISWSWINLYLPLIMQSYP